jgi:hypothetical protein
MAKPLFLTSRGWTCAVWKAPSDPLNITLKDSVVAAS